MSTPAQTVTPVDADLHRHSHIPLPHTTPMLSLIGHPVQFSTGPFAGRTIRVQLIEIQQADRGRKSGNRDVRPIDPPPIVRPKIFEVFNSGTPAQREQEIERTTDVENCGWICHVDLFPMPTTPSGAGSPFTQLQRRSGNASLGSGSPTLDADYLGPSPTPDLSHRSETPISHPTRSFTGAQFSTSGTEPVPGPWAASSSDPPRADDSQSTLDTIATYMCGLPVLESSKRTTDLVGNTFTQSSFSRNQLVFVFSNLAVREEGDFFLRYRAFNTLYPVAGAIPLPILAECIGGPFRIYPTNGFPGLNPSTNLTKEVLRSGVRVTARATERKRRRSGHGAESLLTPTDDNDAAASSSSVQRGLQHIAPVPVPGVSAAAMAASAGLRIVHEEYPSGRGPASHGARSSDARRRNRPDEDQ